MTNATRSILILCMAAIIGALIGSGITYNNMKSSFDIYEEGKLTYVTSKTGELFIVDDMVSKKVICKIGVDGTVTYFKEKETKLKK